MSAFSVASVAGVPLGLWLAELTGTWQAPFAVLGALCGGVLVLAACVLPPLRGHLGRRHSSPVNALAVATDPNHVRAFALMVSLVGSSFLVVPYLATFMVSNVGLEESDLKYIYLFGGLTTLLTLTWIGRIADRRGKLPVFRVLALSTTVPFFLITVLPHGTPLALVLAVTTLLFVVTSGRMVPGMALITNSSAPRVRGSFMSLNSAVQQFGAGLAAWLGGYLLHKGEDGRLTGYPLVGVLACCAAVASVYLAGRLRPAPGGTAAPDTAAVHPGDDGTPPAGTAAEIAGHFHTRPSAEAFAERGGRPG
jgi:predicted MFS family arabinose efflux permease